MFSVITLRTRAPTFDFPKRYTLTVDYPDGELGTVIENTLAVQWWTGGTWGLEPSSSVDGAPNWVTAMPDHMPLFAVLGETQRAYLPLMPGSVPGGHPVGAVGSFMDADLDAGRCRHAGDRRHAVAGGHRQVHGRWCWIAEPYQRIEGLLNRPGPDKA